MLFISQHEANFSRKIVECSKANIAERKGVKPKISYRKFGREAVPGFRYEANSDLLGPENKWPLLQGGDNFQIARSCLLWVRVKQANLLSLGFKVDPFFLLHLKDKQSKEIEAEIQGLVSLHIAPKSYAWRHSRYIYWGPCTVTAKWRMIIKRRNISRNRSTFSCSVCLSCAPLLTGYKKHEGITSFPPSWGCYFGRAGARCLVSEGVEGGMFFGYIRDVPMQEYLSISCSCGSLVNKGRLFLCYNRELKNESFRQIQRKEAAAGNS